MSNILLLLPFLFFLNLDQETIYYYNVQLTNYLLFTINFSNKFLKSVQLIFHTTTILLSKLLLLSQILH